MNVREARKHKNMTQMELAIAARVPQTTISSIECGRAKNPSVDTAHRIAIALGHSVEELFPLGSDIPKEETPCIS